MRAKYKIRNNWLTHSYSGHATPFWKSLLGIKHLISEAACILFGNGDSIWIWSDPWILDLPSFIPSPKVDANPDLALVVSQLLSSDHSRWDIPKLNYFFEEPVVDLILKIPILIYQTEDSWSWTVTNSRSFSAKSAYWLCRAVSSPSNTDAIRGQIWKTKLHERHKMNLWRIAANMLPSKEVINKFNEKIDRCCPLCSSTDESTLHLFTICTIAKSIWFQSQWGLRMEAIEFGSPSNFICFLISPPSVDNLNLGQKEEFLLFGAILCDVIWKQRNRSLFENVALNFDGVASRISSLFAEHKNSGASTLRHLVSTPPQVWIPPSRLNIKINVDAVVGPRYSAITVVVRVWRGELVFAASMKMNTTLSLQAEAKAIRWAISLAPALVGESVIVESNSHSDVQLLSNLAVPPRIKSLCSDLRSLLSLSGNVSIS